MPDPIAIYAALVATLAVVWQVYTWRLARRPDIVVELERRDVPGFMVDLLGPFSIAVTVRNRSHLRVHVEDVGLYATDSPARVHSIEDRDPDALPRWIAAQGCCDAVISYRDAVDQGIDLSKPLVGYVTMATGERVTSKPLAFSVT